MAKVNITITATVAQLSNFSDELGYLSEIAVGQEPDGTTIMGANPQTKAEYLQEQIKRIVADGLAKVKVDAIDREIRDQRYADKNAIKTGIANSISISIT